MRFRLLPIVLVVALLTACGTGDTSPGSTSGPGVGQRVETSAGGYTLVTVDELAGMRSQRALTLVNVHVPYEGEIERTDLFVPYDHVEEYLDQLPAKDARVVVYCRSGPMSAQAARTLVTLGYTDVYDLDGGMTAWEAAGLALRRP